MAPDSVDASIRLRVVFLLVVAMPSFGGLAVPQSSIVPSAPVALADLGLPSLDSPLELIGSTLTRAFEAVRLPSPPWNPVDSLVPWSLVDPEREHHTRYVPPDAQENYTGVVGITEDWYVSGTVRFHDADVRFHGDVFIQVMGSGFLQADGATRFSTVDETPATILSVGAPMDLRGTPAQPIQFRNVIVAARDGWWGGEPPVTVSYATFQDGSMGLLAGQPNVTVDHASFSNLSVGLVVPPLWRDSTGDRARNDPRASNITFVGNGVGYLIGRQSSGSLSLSLGAESAILGRLEYASFQANLFGVVCQSRGYDPDPDDPLNEIERSWIRHANFNRNYLEGYAGIRGITVVTPVGNVELPSSACGLKDLYFGDDSVFLGSQDSETGRRSVPWSDLSAPPSPLQATIITNAQTWDTDHDLSGPLVVAKGGRLTVQGATVRGHRFAFGSAPGGELNVVDATVEDAAATVLRNDADDVDGLTLAGSPRFLAALVQWRNNNTIEDLTARDVRGLVWAPMGGSLTDDHVWQAGIDGCDVRRSEVFALLMVATGTVENCEWEDVDVGIAAVAATLNLNDNTGRRVLVGVLVIIGTFTANRNTWENGGLGYVTALATASITQGAIAAQLAGVLSVLDVSVAYTSVNLTFNGYGMIAVASTVSVQTSNVVHSYLLAFTALGVTVDDVTVPGRVICTSCWMPNGASTDESWMGDVTVTHALTPNLVDRPSWAGEETIADSGATIEIPGGRLEAPALARRGGRLRADNVTLDLHGFVPIGAKGGGMGGGTTGKLTFANVTLVGPAFVAINSTDATFRFTDFGNTSVVSQDNGPVLECSKRFVVTHAGHGSQLLRIRRNALGATERVTMGLFADDHPELHLAQNRVPRTSHPFAAFVNSTIVAERNNWDAEGFLSLYGSDTWTPVDLRSNYWGHPTGPYHTTLNPTGEGTRVHHRGAAPLLSPFLPDPHPAVPCAAFDYEPTTPTDGDVIRFSDRGFELTPDGVLERRWSWGDGTPDTIASDLHPEHQYADDGDYLVRLTIRARTIHWVEDENGWHPEPAGDVAGSVERSIHVLNALPRAGFHLGESPADAATRVDFVDDSFDPTPSGHITERRWNFGDGTPDYVANGTNVSHLFPDGGTYNVSLTVTDDDGATHSTWRQVPVANFSPTPANPTEGAPVTLRATWRPTPQGSLVNFTWHLGDDLVAYGRNVTHTWMDDAEPLIHLRVQDDQGGTDDVQRSVHVSNVPPTADFTYAPLRAEPGEPVSFEGSATDPSPVDVLTYQWNFGDGDGANGSRVQHAYAERGNYEVTLTVTDDDGGNGTRTRVVSIGNEPPLADFSFAPAAPTDLQDVAFTDASTDPDGTVVAWRWEFGDGSPPATVQHPTHRFMDDGTYAVRLTVTDDQGGEGTRTIPITVSNVAPTIGYRYRIVGIPVDNPPSVFVDEPLEFFDDSTDPDGTLSTYEWEFGDGTTSTAENPLQTYRTPGRYTIRHVVTDDDGALDIVSFQLQVCHRVADTPVGPIGYFVVAEAGHVHVEACARVNVAP